MLSATHQKRPVNSKLLSEMWSCWNTDAINRSARNVILRAIQRDNLIFTRGGKRVKISRSLQVVIDNSWESFLSNAVDSAFVSGCVVYFFQVKLILMKPIECLPRCTRNTPLKNMSQLQLHLGLTTCLLQKQTVR